MFDEAWHAVDRGDWATAERLIDGRLSEILSTPDAAAFLRAAVRAGHAPVVDTLVMNDVDAFAEWPDGGDALSWAADHGDLEVVMNLLGRRDKLVTGPIRRALDVARAWLPVDEEDELRRRLGAPDATVEREQVPYDDGYKHSIRIRITANDGREAQVLTAHRAIVTDLEDALGMAASHDELLTRALHDPDPDSCDWNEAVFALTERREPEQTYGWAIARVSDAEVWVRRFVADVLHGLSFQERPFREEAVAALRLRLAVEGDSVALVSLLSAYGEFDGPVPEIRAHARHRDPRVRGVATAQLGGAVAEPETVVTLIALADDSDGGVRCSALGTLARSDLDTPQILAVYAAHRDDEHERARVEALAGLALHGDDEAFTRLQEIGGAGGRGPAYWRWDEVRGLLDYRERHR